ncbi:U4/U6 small nuclear ribonucleoprotein Prp3 [Zancudomyces culisetae]|uniref:U4/U6 small nuclear ribonucleoprotein Prp3 n=1 Tax=Zancudomyces culisetae TaxID=1213189 RepID=A0A1R1PNW2_ZANCU|nr:U4/U6 small nuclear ribonucleoprotein Prp3 [Zancudomyces culisetae]|eukprot:OMH82593.1 U4/U6 small nuclear ribonucleoprotein Prp3 [Zancudomyces culisetae]
MEQLKREIAERARKVGLASSVAGLGGQGGDEEMDEAALNRLLIPQEPPAVEWWDSQLLANGSYDDIDRGNMRVEENSTTAPITHYIQHPVPIKPPMEELRQGPATKKLYLTKKETKKLRRLRRLELNAEKREKIRMGLIEAEPPKLKLQNMVKVMGTDAIQGPSKVEAMTRSQIEQRKAAHLNANNERKLTKEQRTEKIVTKAQQDLEKNGVFVNIYKIGNLSNPRHKFKLVKNAQQLYLTGVVLINSHFCLVVVEGGIKGIRAYKKLLMHRIDWSESLPDLLSTANNNGDDENGDSNDAESSVQHKENSCMLVWEGQVASPSFRSFKSRVCPTENDAKSWLARANLVSYWETAKHTQKTL